MIEFRAVSKRFGDKVVLDDFSLAIPEGETTVLLGYSGTGKSVALKHIVGLIEPDAGDVAVDGQMVNQLGYDDLMLLRTRIGYVFQFAALFDSLSVGENLALGLRRQGLEASRVETRVAESLKLVELEGAIALRPRYILYDEPTTGLDPVTTAAMDDLMVRARRELGATSVVVTHDLRSAFAVADRIAFLYQGRIRQVGSVAEIRDTTDPLVREFLEGRPTPGGGGHA